MEDLSLNDIAEKIINAILQEPHINRESLQLRIRPILKIWLKKTDEFRTPKVPKTKLQFTIENREIQLRYWLNITRKIAGLENMQPYYDELDKELKEKGYKK